ncbi:MAG: immunoglobulin domain-containing protein [Opitutae bacterium]|nr:immunoglobulin domain-containing protein [Opitutae bacterium]
MRVFCPTCVPLLAWIAFWLAPVLLPAAVYDLALGDAYNRALRLNVPDALPVVRGLIIYGNGANGDARGMATDPELVALAETWGFAVLATSRFYNFSSRFDAQEFGIFEARLQELATLSRRPELTVAPWLPIGHSNGGQMSYGFNTLRPEKVIAIVASKGAFYNDVRPEGIALRTPGLLVAGEVDPGLGTAAIRDLFYGNRPRGALWAWVEDQGVNHSLGNSNELTLPFVAAMVQARYPAGATPVNGPVSLVALDEQAGWLTDPESYQAGLADIAPYASYPKDKTVAGWLPSRRLAYIFRAFASYNKATPTATLSTGAGPIAAGTPVTYTIGQPVALWTAIEFYEGDILLRRSTPAESGALSVTATPTAAGYAVYHALVTFADGTQRTTVPRRVLVRTTLQAPGIGSLVNPPAVDPGGNVTLTASVTGHPVPVLQWRKDGAAIPGATNATFTLANAQAGDMGFYSVTASNSQGTVESDAVILTVNGGGSRLANLSARGLAGTGENALTPGIVLRGAGRKPLLIRAVGPTLGSFGVSGVLSDPTLEVIPLGATTALASNDNWGASAEAAAVRAATSGLQAFALAEGSRDAAVLPLLNTAAGVLYTVRVEPAGTTAAGLALAEVYDPEGPMAPVRLCNLSTRGYTGPGETVLMAGFFVVGDGAKRVLIRAVGPSLAPLGVRGALEDPQLRVIPLGKNLVVARNDNWGGTTALQAAFAQVSAFALPADSRDAAVAITLPPGGYTVLATGAGDTTGVVLIEVYDMDR